MTKEATVRKTPVNDFKAILDHLFSGRLSFICQSDVRILPSLVKPVNKILNRQSKLFPIFERRKQIGRQAEGEKHSDPVVSRAERRH